MRNTLLYDALRLTSWVMRFIPLRVLHAVATAAGSTAFYLFRAPRQGILTNLAVALPDRSKHDRTRAARCAFCNDAKNWVDTLRISRLTGEEILSTMTIEGSEHLEAAAALGKGVILVTMHLGNFDLVGQWLVATGYRLTIPVERMQPPQLFDWLVSLRGSRGINIVPVERGPREMLRALRRGEIAGLAGDRDFTGNTIPVDFFGRRAHLPAGPARLARHSGAPLLIGIGIRKSPATYGGYIRGPIELQRTSNPQADAHENTRRLARILEEFVRHFPEQWLAFSPIWPARTDSSGLATIGQHDKAAV